MSAATAATRADRIDAVGGAGRVAGRRAIPTTGGLVVEREVRCTPDGAEHLWREVDLFHTGGEAITEHGNGCTSTWDAATTTRQAVEAPVVAR